jgi:TolA-binding protein
MRSMNQDPRFLLDLAQWGATGLLALFLWIRRPGQEAGDEAKRLKGHVVQMQRDITQRLTILEERWQHVPTRVEIARLEGDIKALQMQMQAQDDTLMSIRAQLTRIEQYLLDTAGRISHNTRI